MNEKDANFICSIVYLISGIVSPLLGLMIDLTGRNLIWIITGISFTIVAHSCLTFLTWINPYISMVWNTLLCICDVKKNNSNGNFSLIFFIRYIQHFIFSGLHGYIIFHSCKQFMAIDISCHSRKSVGYSIWSVSCEWIFQNILSYLYYLYYK